MNYQIFAICCALFLAQDLVIHAKPQPDDFQAAELRDAADIAEKLFSTLMATIDKAVEKASSTLKSAVLKVNETVINIEGKAHDAINLAMDPINAKLKDLIGKAEKLGINTTKCENYIDDLTALPNNLSDNMVECTTGELLKATGYVQDGLAKIQEIEQNMANYTNQIKDCKGHIWSEIKCLGHLTAKMSKDIIEVPVKIAADVTKTSLLITKLLPEVGTCFTKSLAQVPINGFAIVGKFASCVGLP